MLTIAGVHAGVRGCSRKTHGCIERRRAQTSNAMIDLTTRRSRLLPKAIAWAEAEAAAARTSGDPLTDAESRLAVLVGVKLPEQVRVVERPGLPYPADPELDAAARETGLLGPGMIGLTLGHAVFVLPGNRTTRLMSHECRHVYQYEQAGSIAAFLPRYLEQILAFGYEQAPLEADARAHETDTVPFDNAGP